MLNKKVILVIITGSILAYFFSTFLIDRNINEEMKELFMFKTHTTKQFDIIAIGDSRVYRGLSAEPFKSQLNASFLNLGYSAGSFSKRALEHAFEKIDPDGQKIILLGITAHGLTEQAAPDYHLKSIQELKKETILEYLYLGPVKRQFKSTTPQYLYNHLFKNIKTENYIQDPDIKSGWVASNYQKRAPYSSIPAYIERLQKTKLSEPLIKNLLETTQNWVDEGYQVIYFYPPSSYNNEHVEDLILGFYREKFAKNSLKYGAQWISLDSCYTSYDGSHLIKESAITLSDEIVNKIKNKQFFKNVKKLNNNVYLPIEKPKFFFSENYSKKKGKNIVHSPTYYPNLVSFANKNHKFTANFVGKKGFISKNGYKKVIIDMAIFPTKQKNHSKIVCDIFKSKKNNLLWKSFDISKYTIPNKWNKLRFEVSFEDLYLENEKIKVYYVNAHKEDVYVDNLKIRFY